MIEGVFRHPKDKEDIVTLIMPSFYGSNGLYDCFFMQHDGQQRRDSYGLFSKHCVDNIRRIIKWLIYI